MIKLNPTSFFPTWKIGCALHWCKDQFTEYVLASNCLAGYRKTGKCSSQRKTHDYCWRRESSHASRNQLCYLENELSLLTA